MAFLSEWLANTGFLIAVMGVLSAVFLALEILFGREEISLGAMLRGILFWTVYMPIAALVMTAATFGGAALGVRTIVVIPTGVHSELAWLRSASAWIAPATGFVVGDFFDYWMHRAQHRFFWRFHSLHHSHTELCALTAVNHWTEPLFRTLMISLPTAFIGVEQAPQTLAVLAFAYGRGFFIHTSSRINLGPLSWLLVDNRYHRIHHSTEPVHFDRNFSTGLPLWDHLFRTYSAPARGEWTKTGLADRRPPRTLASYLGWSFSWPRLGGGLSDARAPGPGA